MLGESLAMFYSHTAQNRTTIDVTAFHFCVRNGNRWYYRTLFARQIGKAGTMKPRPGIGA